MSVYTSVSDAQMRDFLLRYDLGELIGLKGIAGGITNTNYFVDTTHGRFVLTLFETLTLAQLPFFLELKDHLNRHQVACPAPIAQKNGKFCDTLCGKPAAIISCLNGADVAEPNEKQCFAVGAMLAKMHLAGQQFTQTMDNPRGAQWWEKAAMSLSNHLPADDRWLLRNEIAFLQANPASNLPSGIIHADLFKDNVLMYYDEVAGFIDFYYACYGVLVYDIAIALNDWARDEHNKINATLKTAFLGGYQSVRPLSEDETAYLPIAHRAAAVRFWVSRLWDAYFPTEGEMTFIKNPDDFRNMLLFLRQAA